MPTALVGDIEMNYVEAGVLEKEPGPSVLARGASAGAREKEPGSPALARGASSVTGPTLVLLHGLGNCAEDWEFQIPVFAKQFRVIVPELRGFGHTPSGRGELTVSRMADDIWKLLQYLQVAQIFMVGYSMGGAVAQQLALDHPGLVRRMVIANSVPTFRPQTLRQKFEVLYRHVVMSLLGPRRLAGISARRMFPREDQAALRQKVIERSRYNSTRSYVRALRALTRWSALERLAELHMPVLVLASEHDYFPRADSLRFAHMLPRGRFHCFAGMHHGLPLEAPERFNAVVLKFLSGA